MTIVTVGIDLAKNVFAVHGVDATGKSVLIHPSVSPGKLVELAVICRQRRRLPALPTELTPFY